MTFLTHKPKYPMSKHMLNIMPAIASTTWFSGSIPDDDLDTTSTQINVTFPYWKKHLKDDADFLVKKYKYPSRSHLFHELIAEKKREYRQQLKEHQK